jgi:hypothetical protein
VWRVWSNDNFSRICIICKHLWRSGSCYSVPSLLGEFLVSVVNLVHPSIIIGPRTPNDYVRHIFSSYLAENLEAVQLPRLIPAESLRYDGLLIQYCSCLLCVEIQCYPHAGPVGPLSNKQITMLFSVAMRAPFLCPNHQEIYCLELIKNRNSITQPLYQCH